MSAPTLGAEPAYPYSPFSSDRGFSKRELFAAMAMQGIMANPRCIRFELEHVGRIAVEAADTLLAELAK